MGRMTETIKKNISLVLGLSIPVLMIVLVAASIYLPRFFAPQPRFDFLYASGNTYPYETAPVYAVTDGRLGKNEFNVPSPDGKKAPPLPASVLAADAKLFIYDVAKNESKMISFADAQKFDLDSAPASPDGFEISYGSRGDGFFPFFVGTDYNTRYLKGHGVSRKLEIPANDPYYYHFQFLGWIKK